MKPTILAACAVLSVVLAGPLRAGSVIEGVTATASSWWTMPDDTNPYQAPVNLVNNLGMTDGSSYDITATHDPNGDAWGQWHAKSWDADPNPTVTFDLGGAFDLDGVHIWNGNQGKPGSDNTGRGVNEFVLAVSTDGTSYTTVGTYNLPRSPYVDSNTEPISAQSFDLTGHNGITHVQIRVNSVHDPANPYANLSEVMFTANIVPEVFYLSRFEVTEDSVTLAFPSEPGQVFSIYRSVDLESGFDTPLVADIPAAAAEIAVENGLIDIFDGGVALVDSDVDFSSVLTVGESYVFVPSNGLNEFREIEVVSWSGNTITIAEDIAADMTWGGQYEVKTQTPTETEWIDTDPPAGKAFYKVGRK